MTERELKAERTFDYASECDCASIGYIPSVHWFYVELNGVCVHTSYTFRLAKKKFDKLIEQYKLVKVEDE